MLKVPVRLIGDHLLEVLERHRAVAADHALGRADAGAIDQDAGRAVLVARFLQRGRGAVGAGDVAADGDAADLRRGRLRAVEVDVEAGDLGAGRGELRRGLGAEAGGGSGDDGGVSFGIHV